MFFRCWEYCNRR